MIAVKAKYVRRSVCECGFSVLKEDIPLGKMYLAYPESIKHGAILCGNCGKKSSIDIIAVVDDRGVSGGMMPLGILELDEGIAL